VKKSECVSADLLDGFDPIRDLCGGISGRPCAFSNSISAGARNGYICETELPKLFCNTIVGGNRFNKV
jgi:hypothetical protein